MPKRSFVMKNGKPQIKEEEVIQVDNRNSVALPGSKIDTIFRNDKMSFIERKRCAFIREYIPGEYDGFTLPKDLDLSEITHTFVIIAMNDMDNHDGIEHVLAHLQPLAGTHKAIVFDVEEGNPMNARVPLFPEQVAVLKQNGEKE